MEALAWEENAKELPQGLKPDEEIARFTVSALSSSSTAKHVVD